LTVLTLIEIIAFDAFNQQGLGHLVSIFFLMKLGAVTLAAILHSKILYFKFYGIAKNKSEVTEDKNLYRTWMLSILAN